MTRCSQVQTHAKGLHRMSRFEGAGPQTKQMITYLYSLFNNSLYALVFALYQTLTEISDSLADKCYTIFPYGGRHDSVELSDGFILWGLVTLRDIHDP